MRNITIRDIARQAGVSKSTIHGSACAVCGFDFGIAFGEEFSGKIEVHHKKPISEIGKNYVVDPVNDLVPVCPNCHMMLHSKPMGVYTIEELSEMRKDRERKGA